MDFTGASPTQAANSLLSFVKEAADLARITLTYQEGELLGIPSLMPELTLRAAVGSRSFYLNLTFDSAQQANTTLAIHPTASHFGAGSITKRGTNIALELRRESDVFRWYGVPVEIDENVLKVIPTQGAPFVLTRDYVKDGIEALSEA